MNIFQVLSQGKARLHEPSMSAVLGYLLDSSSDHGLGDVFIRGFLQKIDPVKFKSILASDKFIYSDVQLEVAYEYLDQGRKDIDIEISLLDDKKNETHRVIIENKIKPGAANPRQLAEYYQAVLQDESELKNLTVVFLTPEVEYKNLRLEFDNLENLAVGHSKVWIYWYSSEQKDCIVSIIRDVLSKESIGAINPINEYMRHTLKAFIKHVVTSVRPIVSGSARVGVDLGDVVEEVVIELKDGTQYRAVRRDSTQIQVYNLENGDKEIARRILAKYIDENGMNIPHAALNTRTIGRYFFEKYKVINQQVGE